jgi:hydrogenase maturation protein HypF
VKPPPAPAGIVAAGAWLKNAACRLDGGQATWSALHGDLSAPDACVALDASLERLAARGPVAAVAHDLHPDFHSTRAAQALADHLGVSAVPVQHHHAHVAAVAAEHGVAGPVLGIALDGFGLGDDGTAWGGELLWVDGARCDRLAHLHPLALPGGDRAAREPWRMAAAALAAAGRGDEIEARLAPRVGDAAARGVAQMLARGVRCPPSTSAGRWFDAAAGLLGLVDRQGDEAQAAIALEAAALRGLAAGPVDAAPWVEAAERRPGVIDLRPLTLHLADLADRARVERAAVLFHAVLADALVRAAARAARERGGTRVVLGGGCFLNRVLTGRVVDGLRAHGLAALCAGPRGPGDAAIALGQAAVAAAAVGAGATARAAEDTAPCA